MKKHEAQALLTEAKALLDGAKAEGRDLRPDEADRVRRLFDRVEEYQKAQKTRGRVGEVGRKIALDGQDAWGNLAKSLIESGNLRAEAPLGGLLRSAEQFGGKDLTFAEISDEARRAAPFVPMANDDRYLFGAFRAQDLAGELTVHGIRQTGSRTVTGDIERDPLSAEAKAELDVALEAVDEAVVQHALMIRGVPNSVLNAEGSLRSFLVQELGLQIREALDAHVISQIEDADPPFGNTGADLPAKLRNGIAEMCSAGHNPSLAILSPTDMVALDLMVEDDKPAAFPWGLNLIEAKSAVDPILVAPGPAGILYRDRLQLDADPFGANFEKNLVDFRAEATALFHVLDSSAFYRIGEAASS